MSYTKLNEYIVRFIPQWVVQHPIALNVGVLLSGTVIAHGIIALSLPILTRLYSSDDFSVLGVYAALIGFLSACSCLRFDIAIPIPKTDLEGLYIAVFAVISSVIIASMITVLLWADTGFWIRTLNAPALEPYLWLVPLGVLFFGLYSALQFWASRKKRFRTITHTHIVRAVAGSATQLGVGMWNQATIGLLLGHMIYSGFGVGGLLRSFWRHDRLLLRDWCWSGARKTLKKYRKFPLISTPETIFNALHRHGPMIMIASFLQDATAGFLFLALRVIALPVGLMGGAVVQVYLSEAPQKYRERQLKGFTIQTFWGLLKIGTVPLVLAGILCPILFPIVFGAEWEAAGYMVSWMVPWFVFQFAASPVSVIFHVIGRLHWAVALQCFGAVFINGAVFLSLVFFPQYAIEFYALASAVFYAIYAGMVVFCAFLSERDFM